MSRGFVGGQRAASPAALAGKRDNIIRTLPVKAGESVTAGDVVDVVGGAVGTSYDPVANEKYVFRASGTSAIAVCALTETTGIICDSDNGSGSDPATRCRVFTRTENALSFGTVKAFDTNAVTQNPLVCRLSGTKFVVTSKDAFSLYVNVGTVNGAAITFGGRCSVSATDYYNDSPAIVPLSETSVLAICSRDGKGARAAVCTVSGTAITRGTEYSFAGTTSIPYISACRLPDSGSSKRVCVCYVDGSDGNKGKAVIATISSSNAVTWGTPVVFDSSEISATDCCADGNDVVVLYRTPSTTYAKILIVNASAVNPSAASLAIWQNTTIFIQVEKVGGKLVAGYTRSPGCAVVLERSGVSLSKGVEFAFNPFSANYLSFTALGDRLLAAYSDGGNGGYGTATLLEVMGDQIAGGFEVTSREAIALQSGSGGQSIDILYDGVAELPGITAGTGIDSPGVRGYAPVDGVLWARPEWDKSILQGSYTGDWPASDFKGTRSRRFSLGFKPSFVILTLPSGTYTYEDDARHNSDFLIVSAAMGSYTLHYNASTTATISVAITDDGFEIIQSNSASTTIINFRYWNESGRQYCYIVGG